MPRIQGFRYLLQEPSAPETIGQERLGYGTGAVTFNLQLLGTCLSFTTPSISELCICLPVDPTRLMTSSLVFYVPAGSEPLRLRAAIGESNRP